MNDQILQSTLSKSAILLYHLIKDGKNTFVELMDVGICKKAQLCTLLNELKKEGWINQTKKGQYEVCEKHMEVPAGVNCCGYTTPLTNTVLVGISPITGLEFSVEPDLSQSENQTHERTGQNVQCPRSDFSSDNRRKNQTLDIEIRPCELQSSSISDHGGQNQTKPVKSDQGGDKYTFKIKDNKERKVALNSEKDKSIGYNGKSLAELFALVDFEHNESHKRYRDAAAKFLAERELSDDLIDRVALGGILGVSGLHADVIKKVWSEAAQKKHEGKIKYKWVDLANYVRQVFEAIGVVWEPCRSYRVCLAQRHASATINVTVNKPEPTPIGRVPIERVSVQELQRRQAEENTVIPRNVTLPDVTPPVHKKVIPRSADEQAYKDLTDEEKKAWHAMHRARAAAWKKVLLKNMRDIEAGRAKPELPTREEYEAAKNGEGEYDGNFPIEDLIDFADPQTLAIFEHFQDVEDGYKHRDRPSVIPFPGTNRGTTAQSTAKKPAPPTPSQPQGQTRKEKSGFESLGRKLKNASKSQVADDTFIFE